MGFVGMIGPPYNNSGYRTQNLYWRQRFAQGRATLVAGFLDVTDFFDVYALASPWMRLVLADEKKRDRARPIAQEEMWAACLFHGPPKVLA